MTEERQGQIALKIVKQLLAKKGIRGRGDFQGENGEMAKQIGVDLDELWEFHLAILPQVLGKMLGVDHVSLTVSR